MAQPKSTKRAVLRDETVNQTPQDTAIDWCAGLTDIPEFPSETERQAYCKCLKQPEECLDILVANFSAASPEVVPTAQVPVHRYPTVSQSGYRYDDVDRAFVESVGGGDIDRAARLINPYYAWEQEEGDDPLPYSLNPLDETYVSSEIHPKRELSIPPQLLEVLITLATKLGITLETMIEQYRNNPSWQRQLIQEQAPTATPLQLTIGRTKEFGSFVADADLDIELSGDFEWADRPGTGILSRDFNPINFVNIPSWGIQSPVTGEGVRVEIIDLETVSDNNANLGNVIVISFPASELPEEVLAQHPEWEVSEGRVYIRFAHLDSINQNLLPGDVLISENTIQRDEEEITFEEEIILGFTGKTGLRADQQPHLDLSMIYVAPNPSYTGPAVVIRSLKDSEGFYLMLQGDENHESLFAFIQRSQLSSNPGPLLYVENIDPVLVWPELDELKIALDDDKDDPQSIYKDGE